ncbi:hypothetical protein pb186bvf_007798 [Paramecium bursaria]
MSKYQGYQSFWGQKQYQLIHGGRVSFEESDTQEYFEPDIEDEPKEKKSLTKQLQTSQIKIDDDKRSIHSNNIEQSLKSILIRAGIQRKDIENTQFEPIIKALAQENSKTTYQASAEKFMSQSKPIQQSIMPQKSIVQQQSIPNVPKIPPPPPPPPPPLLLKEQANLRANLQRSSSVLQDNLFEQIKKGVQLRKVEQQGQQEEVPQRKEGHSLTMMLAQAIDQRRHEMTKNQRSSSSSSFVLIEYTEADGDFPELARRLLFNLKKTAQNKLMLTKDQYIFCILCHQEMYYVCMIHQNDDKQAAFQFLENLKEQYQKAQQNQGFTAVKFTAQLAQLMKQQTKKQPDAIGMLEETVEDLNQSAFNNLQSLISRDVKLDVLMEQTKLLTQTSDMIYHQSRRIRSKVNDNKWRLSFKLLLFAIFVFFLGIVYIFI